MASVWLDDDQQRVWRNYLVMGTRLQAAMNRQLQRDCGLSLADYDVLVALSERGALRIFELAELLGWEQSRLSHQLRRMRDRALVDRHSLTLAPGQQRPPAQPRRRHQEQQHQPGHRQRQESGQA
ncbi:MAG TPA: helix-turn-helix domain-containing protein [Mycobacterium sp.]|nr:helix-turn-helix domain-containing protein [Mycobacterium sp.]